MTAFESERKKASIQLTQMLSHIMVKCCYILWIFFNSKAVLCTYIVEVQNVLQNTKITLRSARLSTYLKQQFTKIKAVMHWSKAMQGWRKRGAGGRGRTPIPPPRFWQIRRCRRAAAARRITTCPPRFSDLAPSLNYVHI